MQGPVSHAEAEELQRVGLAKVTIAQAKRFHAAGLPVLRSNAIGAPLVPQWLYHVAGWSIPAWSAGELLALAEHQATFEAAWRLGGDKACDALLAELQLYGGWAACGEAG